jgi:L-ascorbate metabolism protein UlaG (beta-lactamase superfamily)
MNSQSLVFLKPNAMFEPLVNRWYAWSYLVSPLTAAMYIANHHIRVMQSFVATPQLHIEALKKPEMTGGPFIHYDATRTKDVHALLERTRTEQADLIELAAAVRVLNDLLSTETGSSLEPLYAKVAPALSGYVELVYDLHHRPSFRVIEPLLYKSRYYKAENQTLALSLVQGDDRAFALSTPRLDEPGVVMLAVPFASPIVDELSRARSSPKPLGLFQDAIRVESSRPIESFFTEIGPPAPRPAEEQALTIRYFGHACLLVESKRTSVMFDPIVPYKFGSGMHRYGFEDLPEAIDYVVITHNHQDHAVLETLLQLRHRVRTIIVPSNAPGNLADPSLKLMFRQLGFRDVQSIDELETIDIDGGSITAIPFFGEHGDLDIRSRAAHLLKIEGKTMLCAADSNNIEPRLYEHLRDMVGTLDVLFIGMECQGAPMSWLYGPMLAKPITRKHDQSRRLDGSDAAKGLDIVERLKPSRVYVYAMGAEPWLGFISSIHYDDASRPIVESSRLVEECRRRGIVAERLLGCKNLVLAA